MALVDLIALTLEIRTEIAANMRAFVPVQSQPAQTVVNRRGSFFRVARFVGILDSEHEHAAVMPREEPIEQCGPRAADVQIARRRWGEADADGGIHGEAKLSTEARLSLDEQLPGAPAGVTITRQINLRDPLRWIEQCPDAFDQLESYIAISCSCSQRRTHGVAERSTVSRILTTDSFPVSARSAGIRFLQEPRALPPRFPPRATDSCGHRDRIPFRSAE